MDEDTTNVFEDIINGYECVSNTSEMCIGCPGNVQKDIFKYLDGEDQVPSFSFLNSLS